MAGFKEMGFRNLRFWKWVLIGKGEIEEEKERSWGRLKMLEFEGFNGEESSIRRLGKGTNYELTSVEL